MSSVENRVKKIVLGHSSYPFMKIIRYFRKQIYKVKYKGNSRYCVICKKTSSSFKPAGHITREEVECIHCGSRERHRLFWLFLQKKTRFFESPPKKMLHIAPENCFQKRFKSIIGEGYLSADLNNPAAMEKMDITSIPYDDQTFDFIYCSHVLEHIADDQKAISEINRVLKDDGWAVLLVPIIGEYTIEDESIITPEQRAIAYGQSDHVRSYGKDYIDRLKESGFQVEIVNRESIIDDQDLLRYGIKHESDDIYICRK